MGDGKIYQSTKFFQAFLLGANDVEGVAPLGMKIFMYGDATAFCPDHGLGDLFQREEPYRQLPL